MAQIVLANKQVIIVDDEDLDLISGYTWRSVREHRTRYAITTYRVGKKFKSIRMHRLILGATARDLVDHKDGNGLNNSRSNIRIATNAQNCHNSQTGYRNTSGFKGVYWHKGHRQWCANIMAFGKRTILGYFADPTDAARAYDEAAIRLHGDFARLNFPVGA